jgi:hypothetical protein
VLSHGTRGSLDDWKASRQRLEQGSGLGLGLYRPRKYYTPNAHHHCSPSHTHLARLCLPHTAAQARPTHTSHRQYYLRVTASVS